jgi:glucose-6-phosphate 1-dehydrogenase
MTEPVARHLFVIVGGTGDLAQRKLLPALYHLSRQGYLAGGCQVLAVARRGGFDDAGYRRWAEQALIEAGLAAAGDGTAWCQGQLHYHRLGAGAPADWRALGDRIALIEREQGLPGNRIFNLAIPPAAFAAAISGLASAGLHRSRGWTRVVVEKPFGSDLASARELNALVHRHFDESQVYRIDHYLGKDTVQNLLSFRFANAIFESLWNRDRVGSVEITMAEDMGVEGRGEFYDRVGALRDIVQNHLTQLLCIIAMELPAALEADFVRDEKAKVLRSIPPLKPEQVVLGQYATGMVNGEPATAYREEEGVAPDSRVETFVALRLQVENWRWQGVPFYLRAGKRLPGRATYIVVNFRCPVLACFEPFTCDIACNQMVMMLQPDEGFDLFFNVKPPRPPFRLERERLRFRYQEAFGELPDAYETLLLAVMRGEQTFFVRADEVELAWRVFDPLLKSPPAPHPYPAGAWGPEAAKSLLIEGEWHDQPSQG